MESLGLIVLLGGDAVHLTAQSTVLLRS